MTGRWAAGCNSSERSGRSARYYEFTLSERREVTLYLQSSTDPYLYLRTGAQQRSGRVVEYDDDGGRGYDARIRRTLEAGTYTIEATTFNPGRGDFTLTLFGTGDAASSPSQPPAEETSSSSSQTPQAPAPSRPAPAPMPALRVADAQAEEGNPYNEGEMHFTVTLSPAANHEVAVSYTTRDGTASGDLYGLYGDYEEEYGRTSFAPGETRKTVRVRLIGDWHDEGPETFSLVLSNPQGAPRRWGRHRHHHQRRSHPCRMERSLWPDGGRSGAGCGGGTDGQRTSAGVGRDPCRRAAGMAHKFW